MRDEAAEDADRIRAAEAILNRGLGKVAELPEEKRQTFAVFQSITPEQIALSQRMMEALPEEEADGDPNSNGAG